jgi:hypothetical protein
MAKPYANMRFTEREFRIVHRSVIDAASEVMRKWKAAPPAEKAFYRDAYSRMEVLVAKFEAVLIADTSQDPEPEEAADDSDA